MNSSLAIQKGTPPLSPSLQTIHPATSRKNVAATHPGAVNADDQIWKSFLEVNPILKLLRPDYYLIFKYTDTCKILYQENLNLDLGGREVNLSAINDSFLPDDLENIRSIDQALMQIVYERKLQPFDYIYKIGGNVSCANPALKRLMRTSILIHCNHQGKASIGFMCFHDVSGMVTSLRPQSYDISFERDLHFLEEELQGKLHRTHPPRTELTRREREIIDCIRQGMSSKEIASVLFISVATVNTHRQNLLRKWEVPNTAALLEQCAAFGV